MVLVLTLATDRTNYVKEFEHTLNKLGYEYKLLGLGKKWEGFRSKMKYTVEALEQLDPNELVIVCDSYDVLFLQTPDVIENRYRNLANGKVVIGLESIHDMFCNFIGICIPEVIEACNVKNPYYPEFKYINAGFMMARARDIYDIYKFMINNDFDDDQKGLFTWVMSNCSKCYFDYHLDFIFNHMPRILIEKNIQVDYKKNGTLLVNKGSTPCAVHIPGQYLDLGDRTESIRNFIIPNRQPIDKIEYFTQCYKKACTPEAYYIGYWWFFILIILILCIVITTQKIQEKSKHILSK